jgi:very-short-patch-repair endonuclease
MLYIICIFIFIFILILILLFKKKKPTKNQRKNNQHPKSSQGIQSRNLMTKTELKYFYTIESLLPTNYRIFPQVSFNSFVHSDNMAIRNQFNRKCCDFLLVHGKDLTPLAVIEVDDPKSHNNTRARQNDAKRDHIVAQAGYITVRIHDNLSQSEVKSKIFEVIRNHKR